MPGRAGSGGSVDWINSFWYSEFLEFCNITLRGKRKQHGITQEKIAKRIGIDQSRISRIEKWGERPNYPTALAIAREYPLTEKEKDRWFHLLYQIQSLDIIDDNKHIGAFDIRTLPEYLDDIEQEISKNQQVLDSGRTKIITGWLEDSTLPKLRQKLEYVLEHNESEAWPIIECLSLALMQYGQTFVFWQPHLEAANSLRYCAVELQRLAQISGQPLPRLLVHYCHSYAEYIANFVNNKHVHSLKHAVLGLEEAASLNFKDPKILHHFYDLKAIALAKLGQNRESREAATILHDLLNSSGLSTRSIRGGLNTIARVESALGSKEFWNLHESIKQEMGETGELDEPFNVLVNIWAELEAMRLLKSPDGGLLDTLVTRAASIPKKDFLRIQIAIEIEASRVSEMLGQPKGR